MDVSTEYYRLFGEPLPDSFEDLRQGAISKKQSVKQFFEEKYNVPAKRTEKAEQARLAAENKIREDERQKVLSQYGNPDTRPLMPSSSPFTRKPEGAPAGSSATAPQTMPWDKVDSSQDRVSKVVAKVLQ